ncbi:MAG: hypothetical protein HY694_05870 [Deltaproteobacteria bacterium]|nr:hypothetical protein [Deltaproteobacteria bacterium]
MFGSKIKLDEDLLKRCKQHAEAAGYSSVEEFIQHTLESALKKVSPASSDGHEKVLERLKGLGYIE